MTNFRGYSSNPETVKTFNCWCDMIKRCTKKYHKDYKHYGARGISVCDRWLESFENFWTDMGKRPNGMSIDRIDNDKGYEPSNCRWATMADQNKNTRHNRNLTFGGETLCMTDWARRIGITQPTLSSRFKRGWTIEQALTTPKIR